MKSLALTLILVGCGGAGGSTPNTGEGPTAVTDPTLGQGVTLMDPTCFEEERCDALDSDCDGRIDEGCEGVESGALEVALAWSGPAALTLEVAPGASEPPSADGCQGPGPHFERRTAAAVERGEYRVSVGRDHECEPASSEAGDSSDGAITTTASVTVTVEGRLVGTYNVQVPDDSVEVVRFSISD